MVRRSWLSRVTFGVVLFLTLATPAIGGPAVGDLPEALLPLVGDTDSFAEGINNRGDVVGRSLGAVTTAVRWDRQRNSYNDATALLPLPGDASSFAVAINNRGQVVGHSRTGQGPCGLTAVDTAVVWDRHGVPTALGPLPGDVEARARGINDAGIVTGISLGPRDAGTCFTVFTPVVWDRNGNPTELSIVAGFLEGFVGDGHSSINNNGAVAGGSIDFNFFPFIIARLWDRQGGATDLMAPVGYFNAAANAINNNGLVVGQTFDVGGADMAVLWDRNGNPATLPPLMGDPESSAAAVNDRGQAAGSSGIDLFGFFGTPAGTAVVWGQDGNPTALAPLAGDTDSFAFAINEPGRVVGTSRDAGGTSTAVVWR